MVAADRALLVPLHLRDLRASRVLLSSAIAGGPDPADYADDLAALIEHLDLADVRIVAQSMGGWSAVEHALRRTGKVKALVLAATTGTIDPKGMREPERSRLEGGRDSAEGLPTSSSAASTWQPARGAWPPSSPPCTSSTVTSTT